MSYKGKTIISVIGVVISTIFLVVSVMLTEDAVISPILATVLITNSTALLFGAIFFAAKVDYETGIYKCRKCGHIFKPTFKEYIWGAHTLTTRHLKCPKCDKKSWCRRIMAKE